MWIFDQDFDRNASRFFANHESTKTPKAKFRGIQLNELLGSCRVDDRRQGGGGKGNGREKAGRLD